MKAWLPMACLLLAGWAHAQQPAPAATVATPPSTPPPLQVRVHQEPPGALVEGETATIKVDMLTPDFFKEAPVLPEVHVDGAYLSLTDETPGHLVETVNGATWSGVSRTYLLTPLVSGALEIPAFDVTAKVGAQGSPVTVQTTPLTLQVQPLALPAGVTQALIASAVTLTQTVTPESGGLHVGDGVTRRIEITAEGAPAMMLPPTEFKPVKGLALYATPPVTRDMVGKQGGFVGGSRVDSASYVIQRRGHYSLPPVTVRWMDSRTRTWRESNVPGVSFHAWWGAPSRPRFALPQQGVMPRLIEWCSSDVGIATLGMLALGGLMWRFSDRLRRGLAWWRAWRERRRHAEPVMFAALKRQRHATSPAALAEAVDAWVRRAAEDGGPPTMQDWCVAYGDDALRGDWSALQDTLYGQASAAWSATAIVEGVSRARGHWRRQRRGHRAPALPPLNPA
ncbi:BatD family protein [Dyella solisilvae]|nr:BatD family protein [Dyella solisilvae]